MRKLYNAPDIVFDFYNQCVAEGYIPSQDDFIEEFGEQYSEWMDELPYIREDLQEEIEDEINPRPNREGWKERGMKITDFY